jgi:hypothetical protein
MYEENIKIFIEKKKKKLSTEVIDNNNNIILTQENDPFVKFDQNFLDFEEDQPKFDFYDNYIKKFSKKNEKNSLFSFPDKNFIRRIKSLKINTKEEIKENDYILINNEEIGKILFMGFIIFDFYKINTNDVTVNEKDLKICLEIIKIPNNNQINNLNNNDINNNSHEVKNLHINKELNRNKPLKNLNLFFLPFKRIFLQLPMEKKYIYNNHLFPQVQNHFLHDHCIFLYIYLQKHEILFLPNQKNFYISIHIYDQIMEYLVNLNIIFLLFFQLQ